MSREPIWDNMVTPARPPMRRICDGWEAFPVDDGSIGREHTDALVTGRPIALDVDILPVPCPEPHRNSIDRMKIPDHRAPRAFKPEPQRLDEQVGKNHLTPQALPPAMYMTHLCRQAPLRPPRRRGSWPQGWAAYDGEPWPHLGHRRLLDEKMHYRRRRKQATPAHSHRQRSEFVFRAAVSAFSLSPNLRYWPTSVADAPKLNPITKDKDSIRGYWWAA